MQDSANNITQYPVVGFDDYIVTDGGKVFRTKHFKRTDKVVEVTEDVQGLISLYLGQVRAYRCTLERLITAAHEGLDPRDKKVEEVIKRNRIDSLLPTVAQRVDAAKNKKDKLAIIQKDVEQALLCELEKRELVNEGSRLLASMASQIFILFNASWNSLTDSDQLVAIEISREGNERRTQSAELKNVLDLAKEMRAQLSQLGITYDDIQKRLPDVVKQPSFYDQFEEVKDDFNELI